jgi:autotransporter-associated beta strand protein
MTLVNAMTFQAADVNSNAFNITLNGILTGSSLLNKTGGGTLTLGAANNYSGSTLINGGTLALGAAGSISSPGIIVGSNTTFDVSQVGGGFTLTGSQTLKGFGVRLHHLSRQQCGGRHADIHERPDGKRRCQQ